MESKRNRVMAKSPLILAVVASITFVCGVHSEDITNIIQCMNTNLTSDVLGRFPANATSTAQNCVLTFVKGSVNGDLKTFASPFSEQIRSSEFGIPNLDNIPASVRNEFSVLMSSIANCTMERKVLCGKKPQPVPADSGVPCSLIRQVDNGFSTTIH